MQEENRKRQEICRAIFDEAEQLLRVVHQHKTNPIKLETPVYAKFEDKFYLLPDDLAKNIRKVHSKIDDANAWLSSTDTVAIMQRDDLWYNYLPGYLATLQQELRNYEGLLTKSESDNRMRELALTNITSPMQWDLFICHASEDKDEVARPLAKLLEKKSLRVWYDEFTLTLGDSLGESIDHGLAHSRFGVVILSPAFFGKKWPQKELNGLRAKEISSGKVILPVWHNVTREYVLQYSPILADRYAVSTRNGLDPIVDEILKAISKDQLIRRPPSGDTSKTKEDAAIQKSGSVDNRKTPIVRIGDRVSSLIGTHQLSLTLLWWKESPICVNGPYASKAYYTFTAKPGMKFIIIAYRLRNDWIREQTTPYLHHGEITIRKGYIYSVWNPIGGVQAEGYNARTATDEEMQSLIGDSGAFKKLLPEESCVGQIAFEIPKDATPTEVVLPQVPLVFRFE